MRKENGIFKQSINIFDFSKFEVFFYSYSHFQKGQPDGRGVNCIQLWYKHNYFWDNTGCGLLKKFVCQDKSKSESN